MSRSLWWSRAPLALTAVTALALGIAVLTVIPGATRVPDAGRRLGVLLVVVGWSYAGIGAYAWLRRPENRTGVLMVAVGLVLLACGLQLSSPPVPFLIGGLADMFTLAVLIHLLLAFPHGRLQARRARAIVTGGYVAAGLQLPLTMVGRPARLGCEQAACPSNPILVTHSDAVADVLSTLQGLIGFGVILAAAAVTIIRARDAEGAERRGLVPVLGTGAAILVFGVDWVVVQSTDVPHAVRQVSQGLFFVAFATLPFAFLAGLVRSRFFRHAALARLLDRLAREPRAVGDALRAALDDASLEVVFWLPDEKRYVDRDGRPAELPADGDSRVATEVTHDGRLVAALLHGRWLCDEPALLEGVTRTAALALENGRLEAELRARLEALRASRARIVEAADAERRRLGRDLHDGAQQRLVSLMLELQLARERWDDDPDGALELCDRAFANAQAAVDELRDLAAGIHPAVLSQRGLAAGIASVVRRAPLPVDIEVELEQRLPLPVETAAYFVVAEALTNVAKYAGATHAIVRARRDGGEAVVEIRDDGVGGADASAGSGLRGLADRVGALDGDLEVESPPGGGTVVRARIPIAAVAPAVAAPSLTG
jgi:signal transduction histidine kinase